MTVAKTISNAALREGANRNEIVKTKAISKRMGKRAETTNNFFTPGKVYNYLVNLYDEPITLRDFRELKPNIRATHGLYTIQYIPAGSIKRNPKFPYLIGQDLVRLRVTVSGPAHWHQMCKRIPELDWLRRNSAMSDDLFAIAKKHPGLVLRFGVDFVKYCNKIEKRAEELGIDIDHKPLVLYQWGKDDVPIVEDAELAPVKTKSDYINELKETCAHITREEDI